MPHKIAILGIKLKKNVKNIISFKNKESKIFELILVLAVYLKLQITMKVFWKINLCDLTLQ